MMNDFSVPYFQGQLQDQFQEQLEEDEVDLREVSEKNNASDERFNSVLNFMELILEKSHGMFEQMMEVLKNFNSSRDWKYLDHFYIVCNIRKMPKSQTVNKF